MMTKMLIRLLMLTILLLQMGCKTDDVPIEPAPKPGSGNGKFSLVVTLPAIEATRVTLVEEGMDLRLTWEENDEIQIAVAQGDVKVKQTAKVSNIREEGKRGTFQFTMPDEIGAGTFDIYAVYGTELLDTNPTVAQLPMHTGHSELIQDIDANKVMLAFSQKEVKAEVNEVRGTLRHLGSILGITIQNTGNITLDNLDEVRLSANEAGWGYDLGAGGTYDLASGQFLGSGESGNYLTFKVDGADIAGGESVAMWGWFPIPAQEEWPEFNIELRDQSGTSFAVSENSKVIASSITTGHNYYVHSQWNGTEIVFTPTMTFTTVRDFSSGIRFRLEAEPEDQGGVWIDLNNNGIMDLGEKVEVFGTTTADRVTYDFSSSIVTVYGKVTNIQCSSMNLISLDVSDNPSLVRQDFSFNSLMDVNFSRNANLEYVQLGENQLEELDLSENQNLIQVQVNRNHLSSLILPDASTSIVNLVNISRNRFSAEAITELINGLPDRTGLNNGKITVLDSDHIMPDGDRDEDNIVEENHVDLAKAKNWDLIDINPPENVVPIEGPSMTFTTTRTTGTMRIRIYAEPEDQEGVWIDFNNDGVMEPSERVTHFGTATADRVNYTFSGRTFTIYGKVTNLEINQQDITSAVVNNNPGLENLNLPFNNLTEIDLSELTELTYLQLGVNQLLELDLSNNPKLTQIQLNRNQLTSIALSDEVASSEEFNQLNVVINRLSESNITEIVNKLPDRNGNPREGRLYLSDNRQSGGAPAEQNTVTTAHISAALSKNWHVWVDNVAQTP